MRAFSQNVVPVSSGSGIGSTSASVTSSTSRPSSSGRISRTLFGFVVAIRNLTAKDRPDQLALFSDQVGDALVGEREQARQRVAAERLRFRGALDLDEAPVARLDDVHVDVGL